MSITRDTVRSLAWNTPHRAIKKVACLFVWFGTLIGPCHASGSITGFVDALNSGYTTGWACVQGANTPVSIAIYFGLNLIGIFPTNVVRNDLGASCGTQAGAYGFAFNLNPNINQQLIATSDQWRAGQSVVTLYAIANGYASLQLPPSSGQAANPYAVPIGILTSANTSGQISGSVTGPSVSPTVNVFSGAPAGSGGTPLEPTTVVANGANQWTYSLLSQDVINDFSAHPPAGYNLPLFAYVSDSANSSVELWNALPVSQITPPTSPVTLNSQATESGQLTGVRNSIVTSWLPVKAKFSGLTGSVSLTGNASNNFSEALVVVGVTTPVSTSAQTPAQACAAEASSLITSPFPAITRLYGAIVKSNVNQPVSIPINFALPYGIPLNGASGTCLTTILSAGYPYPPSGSAYTTTSATLSANLTPAPDRGPATFSAGIGNEFHIGVGANQSTYDFVALQMKPTSTELDAISGSVSVAGVAGTTNPPWSPVPTGNWTANTVIYYYPAADCSALSSTFTNGGPYYSSAIGVTASGYTVPPDATLLASIPVSSYNAAAVQQSTYTAFDSGPGTSNVVFSKNDCIVSLHSMSSPGDSLNGNIDFENQSSGFSHVVVP